MCVCVLWGADLAILLLSVFLTRRIAVMLAFIRKCCARSGGRDINENIGRRKKSENMRVECVCVCITGHSLLGEDQVRLEADDVFTDLLDVLFLHLQDPGEVFLTSDLYVRLTHARTHTHKVSMSSSRSLACD